MTQSLGRRRMLMVLGGGALGLAGCGASPATSTTSSSGSTTSSASASGGASGALTEIPEETAGPYPGDGSDGPDVLAEDGIVRQDITTASLVVGA